MIFLTCCTYTNRFAVRSSVRRVGAFGAFLMTGCDRWNSVEVATVRHRTSRADDPHRHVRHQINGRVHAASRWRAVDGGSALGGSRPRR
jgi:hypothetical protein